MAGKSAKANNRGLSLFSNFVSGKARDFRTAANALRKAPPFYSSGGTVYTPGNGYTYHVFTNSNPSTTFTLGALYPDDANTVNLLLVAGGGGGGAYYGGGGGAGGVVNYTGFTVTKDVTHTVSVGAGGLTAGGDPGTETSAGGDGGDTTFSGLDLGTISAAGGGGGTPTGDPNGNGGSGGGRGSVPGGPAPGGSATQPGRNPSYSPLGTFNQYGNPGGAYPVGSTGYAPGGGGGAGAAGGNGFQAAGAGNGGVGIAVPWADGSLIPILAPVLYRMGSPTHFYGGGGGGGAYSSGSAGTGGAGGGGTGSTPGGSGYSQAGADLLGGGGGGRHPATKSPSPAASPTAGGSGICIVRITAPS